MSDSVANAHSQWNSFLENSGSFSTNTPKRYVLGQKGTSVYCNSYMHSKIKCEQMNCTCPYHGVRSITEFAQNRIANHFEFDLYDVDGNSD